ncbi:cupin-like domain-containing protein [Mastigocladus laminosus UU774]|nr:cupin-like domain-containing protein [Mastigocladus laminosus UU774]
MISTQEQNLNNKQKDKKVIKCFMKTHAVEEILRIKNPSTKQFLEMWQQYQPFIIEDVATHWDICNKWSNDYLIKHCGDNLVPVRFFTKDYFTNYENFAYESSDYQRRIQEMTYKEYIKNYVEDMSNESKNDSEIVVSYLPQANFEEHFPEVIGDVTYPEYLNRKPNVLFWQGFSKKSFCSTTNLHFDGIHNLFCQIRGRKRILLFPPSDYLSFYPALDNSLSVIENSKVNPDFLDLELFPKFPWQEKIEVVLQPGEIIYIPPFWWHYITAVDENISLLFFYPLEIGDVFRRKKLLRTILNIAPHYLYNVISYRRNLMNFVDFSSS